MSNLLSQWAELFPKLLPGLAVTVELTVLGMLIGLPFGILFAIAASSPVRWVRYLAVGVIELGRGTPGLIVLYIAYYGLPQVHLTLPAFVAAVVALSFTTAAYTSEIVRAGIKAVPAGQREAASALALTPVQEMRRVVLPQALRIVVPPLIGWTILLYQGTSLCYAIGVPELLSRAYNEASITYQFAPALLLAGAMYAAVSLPVSLLTHATVSRT